MCFSYGFTMCCVVLYISRTYAARFESRSQSSHTFALQTHTIWPFCFAINIICDIPRKTYRIHQCAQQNRNKKSVQWSKQFAQICFACHLVVWFGIIFVHLFDAAYFIFPGKKIPRKHTLHHTNKNIALGFAYENGSTIGLLYFVQTTFAMHNDK